MKGKKNIKENFKQIALPMFAITLIGVGYINFSMQTENQRKLAVENKANIGDVELVKYVYDNVLEQAKEKDIKNLVRYIVKSIDNELKNN